MARHISRKELKKDEIRETFKHGAKALFSHRRAAWIIGSSVLLVLVAVLGWRFYTQRLTASASAELIEAMKIYQARIRDVNEPAFPGEITYVEEKNKYSDAADKFTEIADRYSRTRPGREARYYTALSLVGLERYEEAEEDLKTLESGSDQEFSALARFHLAQVYDRTDRGPEAPQLYQQLLDNPSVFVPKAVILLAMADHYTATDPEQAAKLYQQVKTEFPDTLAAEQADQRLQLLTIEG